MKKKIKHSGKNIKIKHDLTKPNIPTYLSVDCSNAKKKLKWKPSISLDKGIIKTLNWWKKNCK